MAEAEELREELKKLKSNGQADAEKERAYTEGGAAKAAPPKNERKLSPQERVVAQNLGLSEKQYVEQLERMGR